MTVALTVCSASVNFHVVNARRSAFRIALCRRKQALTDFKLATFCPCWQWCARQSKVRRCRPCLQPCARIDRQDSALIRPNTEKKHDVNAKSALEVRFATKTRCAAVMDANSSMQLDWEVASLSDLLRQTSEVWATSFVEGQPAARSVHECHADKGFPPPSCEVLTWMSATGQTGWGAGCPQDMRHEPKSRCLARRARRNKGLEGTHCPEACVCSGFLRRTVP